VAAPPGRGRGTCSARYAHSRGPLIARVLGVDACSKGWVGIAHDGTRCDAYFGATIAEVVAAGQADGAFDVVAIDIPIGLPDSTSRRADELARRELGPRRSSLFMTPVRRAVLADDHASASRINRELTDSGISMQAFMLKPKLLEVEAWVLAFSGRWVSPSKPSSARPAGSRGSTTCWTPARPRGRPGVTCAGSPRHCRARRSASATG